MKNAMIINYKEIFLKKHLLDWNTVVGAEKPSDGSLHTIEAKNLEVAQTSKLGNSNLVLRAWRSPRESLILGPCWGSRKVGL